jgi:hypothetical protein
MEIHNYLYHARRDDHGATPSRYTPPSASSLDAIQIRLSHVQLSHRSFLALFWPTLVPLHGMRDGDDSTCTVTKGIHVKSLGAPLKPVTIRFQRDPIVQSETSEPICFISENWLWSATISYCLIVSLIRLGFKQDGHHKKGLLHRVYHIIQRHIFFFLFEQCSFALRRS